jgi:hypothetical protein
MKNTEYEVHMFLGKGRISGNLNYPVGEVHAFIFYLLQYKDTDYDLDNAEETINEIGMDQIEFSKMGKLDASRVNDNNRVPYEKALEKGSSIVVYTDPI